MVIFMLQQLGTQRVPLIQFFKPSRIDAQDWYFREQNVCAARGRPGAKRLQGRRTSGQERGQRSRVDAPWPRRCIHDIIYPCSSALCLCSCIRKRCARLEPLQHFIRSRCKLQKSSRVIYRPVICRRRDSKREPQPFLPPPPPLIILAGRLFSRHFN